MVSTIYIPNTLVSENPLVLCFIQSHICTSFKHITWCHILTLVTINYWPQQGRCDSVGVRGGGGE